MLTNLIPRTTAPLRPIQAPDQPVSDSGFPVGQIEAVCFKHSIPCGDPDSLERFVRALHDDKYLAMDFWSLVARLTDQHQSAEPNYLLIAIVEGVTGHGLDDVNASSTTQRLLVRQIAGLLAGEDVQTPLPPRPVQSVRPSNPSDHIGPFRRDAVPRRGAVPPPPSAPNPSTEEPEQPRLVLRTDTPFAAAMDRSLREREPDHSPPEPESEPQIAIPLAAYAEETADGASVSRKLVGGILLALGVGGILLYHNNWKRLGASIHTQYAAVLARSSSAAAPSAASINGNQRNFTTNPSTSPPTPLPTSAPENPNPRPIAAAPDAKPINPQKPAPVAVAASVAPPPGDRVNPTPHAEAQVEVPESEMKQNLVSSRVPIFPTGANGTVVIQAVVTTRGTVEPVRVVSGNPALAHAAMVAVATWHYRPYMQDGMPVNVSTTISVDSAGNY
jgi:TonB family protein